MKNAFLALILSFAVLSCASRKKSSETRESVTEIATKAIDSSSTKTQEKKSDVKEETKATTTTTTTAIKYTPKINQATGKYEPFNYTTTKNGKPETTISVNGAGEVLINQISSQLDSLKDRVENSYEKDVQHYQQKISQANAKIYSLEKQSIKQSSTNFWLWLWLIILAVLLAISIYFHVARTGIPFLNKKG